MKKLICALLAIMAIGCFAGCVDHNDGKCDECDTNGGMLNPVLHYEGDELCATCADKKFTEAELEAMADAIEAEYMEKYVNGAMGDLGDLLG